jgi:hypothetical protein
MNRYPALARLTATVRRVSRSILSPALLAWVCVIGLGGSPAFAQYTETLIHNPGSPSPPTRMGWAVDMDGNTLAVGLPNHDDQEPGEVQIWIVDEFGMWTLEAELRGGSATDADVFGESVALSGDTLIVGASRADGAVLPVNEGAAYIFTRAGGVWTQQARLKGDEGVGPFPIYFGSSVAISGDTAVVSAWNSSVISPPGDAAVYVYTRTAESWSLQQKLTVAGKLIGAAVALSGDLLMAGEGGGGVSSFERASDGVWTVRQTFTGSSTFGSSLRIEGDIALIGAPFENVTGVSVGTVHVYSRANRMWGHSQTLNAVDWAFDDQFGSSLAVTGDTILIGSTRDDDGEFNSGSVYVFKPSVGGWDLTQKLVPDDPSWGKLFGFVAASGDFAVIGAPLDDEKGEYIGAAYVYANSEGAWIEHQKISAARDSGRLDDMGTAIAVSGNVAFFGLPNDYERGVRAGAVYVFTKPFGFWIPQQKLVASDGIDFDGFGHSIATSGNSLIVGTRPTEVPYSGAAYIFHRNFVGAWIEEQKLSSPNPESSDFFGSAVAISGDTAFVGAFADDDLAPFSGAVYVFASENGIWTQREKLVASDAAENDEFGSVIASSGASLIVGTSRKDTQTGAAYIFTNSDSTWSNEQRLNAAGISNGGWFGSAVAIEGDTAIVGAPRDDAANTNGGSVTVFERAGGVWTESQVLVSDDNAAGDNFGSAVSISGDELVVTSLAPGLPENTAYVFSSSNGAWSQRAKLVPIDMSFGGFDDTPVAISGGSVFLSGSGGLDPNSGTVYVYSPPIVLPSAVADSWTLFE